MQSPERLAAELLRHGTRACAVAAVEELARRSPDLVSLPSTFADPVEDTRVRLLTLVESLDVDRPQLLARQVEWYKVALSHRGVAADYLPANLEAMRIALRAILPAACLPAIDRHLAVALDRAATAPIELPSLLEAPSPQRDLARQFLLAVLENRKQAAIELVLDAHRRGTSIADLHDHVLALAQREVGRMWLMAEIPIADEHYASRLVEACMDRLAAVAPPPPNSRGVRVLTATAGGDLHSIGVRMVAERLTMAGFDVIDLGADMPASDFQWLLQDRRVDAVVLGATMVLHLGSLRASIASLRALGPSCPPIVVGGAPFAAVADLHTILGADAAAVDPAAAVAAVEDLLRQKV